MENKKPVEPEKLKESQPSSSKNKELTFAEYCMKCYGGVPTNNFNLPVDYAFAQANYTQYLVGLFRLK